MLWKKKTEYPQFIISIGPDSNINFKFTCPKNTKENYTKIVATVLLMTINSPLIFEFLKNSLINYCHMNNMDDFCNDVLINLEEITSFEIEEDKEDGDNSLVITAEDVFKND